jgi:hypothetical protein
MLKPLKDLLQNLIALIISKSFPDEAGASHFKMAAFLLGFLQQVQVRLLLLGKLPLFF